MWLKPLNHNHNSQLGIGMNRNRRGFTLIELLVVITIIGLLVSVILVASYSGIRTANRKATEALVLKLDLAVKERMQALLDDDVVPNATHIWLATPAANKLGGASFGAMRGLSPGRAGNARAQAIAMTDYLRAEMPDVFVLNPSDLAQIYPFNFGGISQAVLGDVPLGSSNANVAPYTLPIGTAILFNGTNSVGGYNPPDPTIPIDDPVNSTYTSSYNFSGTGVFGASYTAAAGIYKQLGYGPAGYDSVDNNGNGLVDEMIEGLPNKVDRDLLINKLLTTHTHKTARSEMLYALLIEGQGPLGSAFSRDDFSENEIQDTDGDGLLEFVDAYGEPLQFFRWPLWYVSDNQRGWDIYSSDPWVQRERNPVDPSNSLVSMDWWPTPIFQNGVVTGVSPNPNRECIIFEYFFHPLSEASLNGRDLNSRNNPPSFNYWDRSNATFRRAFRYTPLIISGGEDLKPGVRLWGQQSGEDAAPVLKTDNPDLPTNLIISPFYVPVEFLRDYESLGIKHEYESMAEPDGRPNYSGNSVSGLNKPVEDEILTSAEDDISSHALAQGLGGGVK